MKELFYDWGGLNVQLFHAINGLHSGWIDRVMLLGTALGDHHLFALYFSLAALAGLLLGARGQKAAAGRSQVWLAALAVFAAAYLLDGLLLGYLKPLLDFPRPPLALPPGSFIVVGTPELHHSFPSGHSSFAMLVGASLWPALNRPFKVLAALFVLWVGISRISLGFHFPADVLGGFVSCLLIVLVTRMVVRWLQRLV